MADGSCREGIAEETSGGMTSKVLVPSFGEIKKVPVHDDCGCSASSAAKIQDTKFPEASSSTSFHSRGSLSIPKKKPKESLSGRDGNDCDFQEDRMPTLLSKRLPRDQSNVQPQLFPAVYEALEEGFPSPSVFQRAYSAAVLSDFEDEVHPITHSVSLPCSPSQRWYNTKNRLFRKEFSRSPVLERTEEMVATGQTLKVKDDLYHLSSFSEDVKETTANNLEYWDNGANIEDECEDPNESASSSGTIFGVQDDRRRDSPVGLELVSVDTEMAFDSRDSDLELDSDPHLEPCAHLEPASEPDSDPGSLSSYEAQVQFPDAVEVHDVPISHQVIPTSCSDSSSSRPQAASDPNVNVFKGFGDIGSGRNAVTAAAGDDLVFLFASTEKVFEIDFTQDQMRPIGRGGRNTVFSDKSRLFAIKKCNYQKDSLNIIYKLKHPNVIPLLGVVVDLRTSLSCLHIMPRMSTDLYRAWDHYRTDGLVKLLSNLAQEHNDGRLLLNEEGEVLLSEASANLLLLNVVYILKEVASGLVYLDGLKLFHGDIKDQNILLSFCLVCESLFSCCCRAKFPVMIADFDSICRAGKDPSHSHVGGTVGYRAPEVCDRGQGIETNRCQCDSKADVYSLGVVKLRMMCGRKDIAQAKRDANLLNRQPTLGDTLSVGNELIFVEALKNKLSTLIMNLENQDLKFLFLVAMNCCEPDAHQRLSANELCEKLKSHKIFV